MITADKVFKGNTEIVKIFKGSNLEWEKPVEKTYKWEPTTYIDADNHFVWKINGETNKTNKATLYIKGYNKFRVQLSIYDRGDWDDEDGVSYCDTYIKAYKLDSTTEIQEELPYDGYAPRYYSKEVTYNINDSKEHTILFEMFSGLCVSKMDMRVYIYKNQ